MRDEVVANDMEARIDNLMERLRTALAAGGEERIAKHHAKGRLTARERLDLLLDDGSFEEFDMLKVHRSTAFGMDEQQFPGGGSAVQRRGGIATTIAQTVRPRETTKRHEGYEAHEEEPDRSGRTADTGCRGCRGASTFQGNDAASFTWRPAFAPAVVYDDPLRVLRSFASLVVSPWTCGQRDPVRSTVVVRRVVPR
jgi:hypothetical protein